MIEIKLTRADYETAHPAVFFFAPPNVGQHRISTRLGEKLDAVGAPSSPADQRTGYTPFTSPDEVVLRLDREELIVLGNAIEQGYKEGAYVAGRCRHVPQLLELLRNMAPGSGGA